MFFHLSKSPIICRRRHIVEGILRLYGNKQVSEKMPQQQRLAPPTTCNISEGARSPTTTKRHTSPPKRGFIVNIYLRQQKKHSPLGGSRSREIGNFKRLLRSYPGIVFVFLLVIGIENIYFLFF